MGKSARVVPALWKLLILLAIIAVLFVAWLLLNLAGRCDSMGNYLYNGVLLPDINTVWTDKTAYPNAYIYQSTFDGGQHYCLVVVDKTGYMGMCGTNHEFGPSYTLGAYELHESEEKTLTYCEWIIAADEDAAGKLSGLWPGITSTEWLQVQKHYSNIHASTGNGIIWSNHKILNEDGSTYVEASNPMQKFDLKSWLTGFALGLAGKPLPFAPAQKEPVAYLYNGVQLPPLPDWDREAYPYAVMSLYEIDWFGTSGTAQLWLYSQHPESSGDTLELWLPQIGDLMYEIKSDSLASLAEFTDWGSPTTITERKGYSIDNAGWANFDMYYQTNIDGKKGQLYLAASDPVPVYE